MANILSYTQMDLTRERSAQLLDHLFPPPRRFGVRLWDGSQLASVDHPAFSLVFNRPDSLRRMFTPPLELSMGEAFIRGDFDIEGDIFAAFTLINVA